MAGVRSDVTEGFIERVAEVCELIQFRIKEYNDLFTFNYALVQRSKNVAILDAQTVKKMGVSGPNARAAGVDRDLRKIQPYCGYEDFDFQTPLGRGDQSTLGSVHDRLLVRLREISQSVEILRQALEGIPAGNFSSLGPDAKPSVPKGEAYALVESARGELGCFVVSSGGPKPWRVQFRAPSRLHLQVLPLLLQGNRIEDVPYIVASLDLGLAEADR